jgi:hypothetical protein
MTSHSLQVWPPVQAPQGVKALRHRRERNEVGPRMPEKWPLAEWISRKR